MSYAGVILLMYSSICYYHTYANETCTHDPIQRKKFNSENLWVGASQHQLVLGCLNLGKRLSQTSAE